MIDQDEIQEIEEYYNELYEDEVRLKEREEKDLNQLRWVFLKRLPSKEE